MNLKFGDAMREALYAEFESNKQTVMFGQEL